MAFLLEPLEGYEVGDTDSPFSCYLVCVVEREGTVKRHVSRNLRNCYAVLDFIVETMSAASCYIFGVTHGDSCVKLAGWQHPRYKQYD